MGVPFPWNVSPIVGFLPIALTFYIPNTSSFTNVSEERYLHLPFLGRNKKEKKSQKLEFLQKKKKSNEVPVPYMSTKHFCLNAKISKQIVSLRTTFQLSHRNSIFEFELISVTAS